MQNIQAIAEQLEQARTKYNLGEDTGFTDQEFDQLENELRQLDPDHSYFGRTMEAGGKVELPIKMGSLNQLRGDAIGVWIRKNAYENIGISDKLDGVSAVLTYDNGKLLRAATRGDGYEGFDITDKVRKLQYDVTKIDAMFLRHVRGEIIISIRNFEEHIKPLGYKNARNFIAGQVNSNSPIAEFYRYAEFIAFPFQPDLDLNFLLDNFELPRHTVKLASDFEEFDMSKYFEYRKSASTYEIDGQVLTGLIRHSYPDTFEYEGLNPPWSIKFKENHTFVNAKVVKVHWGTSKDGYLKPRVEIEPVDLSGVTIRFATGFNAKFIEANGIGQGAIIELTRSGDVIPHITGIIEETVPDMPDRETIWSKSGVDLIAIDEAAEESIAWHKYNGFFANLGIDNFGSGASAKLYDAGYTIEQVIKLDPIVFIRMFGPNLGASYHKQLHEKLQKANVMQLGFALGVYGRGNGWSKVASTYLSNGDFNRVKGISYDNFVELYASFDKVRAWCRANNVPVNEYQEETIEPVSGRLSGRSFVFTGFRDASLEKRIQELGGSIWGAVKPGLTYLVSQSKKRTRKIEAASNLGVSIIDKMELLEILDNE